MLTTLSPIDYISTDIKCDDLQRPKRKRQRLDHLSQEEKLMRRKLKNRMAAQSARDRKKVKMQDLEEEVAILSKERNALLNQNEALRLKNLTLKQENEELKRRLGLLSESRSMEEVEEVSQLCKWSEAIESAELINFSQPKKKATQQAHSRSLQTILPTLMMLFVYWSLIKNLTLFSTYFTCILKSCSIQILVTKKPLMTSKCQLQRRAHHNWSQLKT